LREGREWKKERRGRGKELSKIEGAIKEGQEIVPCLISWDDMGVQHAVANTFRRGSQPDLVISDYRDSSYVGNTEW
jgi:hypothetical protein